MRLLSLFFLTAVVWSCQSQEKEEGNLSPNMNAGQFQQAIKENKDAVIIDVRTPAEVQNGFIEGAINMDINSPEFADGVAKLDKEKTYFVYCHSGGRSASAASYLKKNGISKVVNLSGGIVGWQRAGLPTVNK
ncbi:MAG: rhodanese-like domain-containing protein [Bacteroidota bacterium]